jgi:CRP/FNR family transcriptional activator FtrB
LILIDLSIDNYQAQTDAPCYQCIEQNWFCQVHDMRESDRTRVRELPLFSGMSEDHFDELLAAGYLQKFPEGVDLIHEGELPDFLHIVVEGMVELSATFSERQTTIAIIRPVATFILAAVIRDEVYLKSARTLTPAHILMIPAAAVRNIFGRDARFARAVVNELAERYRGLVRELKNQKLRAGTERLAAWILSEEQRQGSRGHVELSFDKRTLASQLGMTPENLSRSLATLTPHSVSSQGRRIDIIDRSSLQLCAKPNSLMD